MAKIPLLLVVYVETQACSCCRTGLGGLGQKEKCVSKGRIMPVFFLFFFLMLHSEFKGQEKFLFFQRQTTSYKQSAQLPDMPEDWMPQQQYKKNQTSTTACNQH